MNWTTDQQDQLLALIHRRNERDILQKQRSAAQAELKALLPQQETLYEELLREELDVDRLERFSWASFYYNLLSRRDEQLTKEKLEAEAALSRYELMKEQTEHLQQHVDELSQKLASFAEVDTAYDALIQQKTGVLLAQSGLVHEQYKAHVDAVVKADKQLQEMEEAFKAGREAHRQVIELKKLIRNAQTLGAWDMASGSALVSVAKYQRLDSVREQSKWVGLSLKQFRSELADVHQSLDINWQFDNTLNRFIDIFFDNIFTDWSVQKRIGQVQDDANMLDVQVVSVLSSVDKALTESLAQAKARNAELRAFLEAA